MADPELLEHFVEEFRPDVLGLVEVLTPNRGGTDWSARLESWRDRWPHQEVMPYGDLFEMVLLSRYPILDARRAEVSDAMGGFLFYPPIMEATLSMEGRPVRVVLVHTHRPGSKRHYRAREVLFESIALTDFEGPRVVLGDFNATGTSPLFRDLLERGELEDTRPGFGACLSWSLGGLPGKVLCLDHVLVGGGLGVALRGTGTDIGSDHLPATAVLRLSSPPPGRDSEASDRNPRDSGTVAIDPDGVSDRVDQR
jgi:endonuclease/exonuclease/phosphatase family metal-dependent hydrolase